MVVSSKTSHHTITLFYTHILRNETHRHPCSVLVNHNFFIDWRSYFQIEVGSAHASCHLISSRPAKGQTRHKLRSLGLEMVAFFIQNVKFLSRVSTTTLTRDIDIGTMSVRLSVCHMPVYCIVTACLTYHRTFFSLIIQIFRILNIFAKF